MKVLRSRGFTVIELLVVVAIIALLSGLLFPVFARARFLAKGRICAGNLLQYSAALKMYCADNDEIYPVASDLLYPGVPDDGVPKLTDTLAPYGAVDEMKRCPLDNYYVDPQQDFAWDYSQSHCSVLGTSYRYRADFGLVHVGDAEVSEPADTLLMGDLWFFHAGEIPGAGKFQVLFVDGHVKLTPWSRLNEIASRR